MKSKEMWISAPNARWISVIEGRGNFNRVELHADLLEAQLTISMILLCETISDGDDPYVRRIVSNGTPADRVKEFRRLMETSESFRDVGYSGYWHGEVGDGMNSVRVTLARIWK